jgi:hypothetical protein
MQYCEKDERTELEAFCEAIVGADGTSICREEEIIRNKRQANHWKWKAKIRGANLCDRSQVRRESGPLNRSADPAPWTRITGETI